MPGYNLCPGKFHLKKRGCDWQNDPPEKVGNYLAEKHLLALKEFLANNKQYPL
jgi:hypothetical protein